MRSCVVALGFVIACGEVTRSAPDAGFVDAGEVDAGEADAGAVDAGELDAGSGSCTFSGISGTCEDFATCSTGFTRPTDCGASAREQCCLETKPATPRCPSTITPTVNDGFTTEEPGLDGCPPGMARVEAFCIDRWEASLVDGASSWSPYRAPDKASLRAVSVKGSYPQGYITQVKAQTACAQAGKRLCTDDEWLRACRGADQRAYPYGTTRVDGRCHDEVGRTAHPAAACFERTDSGIYSLLDDPGINQAPDALAAAGSHADCVTPEAVFDLVGNLHEWTADPAGTFRGGFYADTRINGSGCAYKTTAHDVSHADYSTGFRCCDDLP